MSTKGTVILLLLGFFLLVASRNDTRAEPKAEGLAQVEAYRALVTDCRGDFGLLEHETEEIEKLLPEIENEPAVARDAYINLAKFNFLLGEMGTVKEERLKSYQQCARYGKQAVDLDDNSAEAHFWYFSGLAREAELKGILKAVMTGTAFKVKGQIKKAYALNDQDAYIVSGLGNYYWKAPRMIGGSKSKAREYLEEAVRLDPRLSFAHLTLAKVLIDLGEEDRARRELEGLLAFGDPTDPNFYQFVNKEDAAAELDGLREEKK
jgi:hypothetical protein